MIETAENHQDWLTKILKSETHFTETQFYAEKNDLMDLSLFLSPSESRCGGEIQTCFNLHILYCECTGTVMVTL